MQTIGSIIDQLSIVNIRIWHLIDQAKNQSLLDSERLKSHDQVIIANGQRNKLIDELDILINQSIKTGKCNVFEKLKL